MSQDERKLRADLAVSEGKLFERTRERDEAQLAVLTSEHELIEIHSEFSTVTTKLALVASKLLRKGVQLDESNQELSMRTEELQASDDALSRRTEELQASEDALHEKECFVAALRNFKSPIAGSTRILEYIAAGKSASAQCPEMLRRLIDVNKNLLTETDRLAEAFLELTKRTTLLDESNSKLDRCTEALDEANAKIRAMSLLMQQREDFVAALIHDLKNPLIGGTKILEWVADGMIAADELPECLSTVIESNKGMLNMIWNMLDVYRSDLGCLLPTEEPVDIAVLLRQCLGEFRFAIAQKQIVLHIDMQEPLPAVTTDRTLLRRVLMNVLDNAVKFTPSRGQLTVTACLEQNEVRLSIKDSGMGMSDAQLERIFDRFWQTPHGRQFGLGTGLGLSIAKQIMRRKDRVQQHRTKWNTVHHFANRKEHLAE